MKKYVKCGEEIQVNLTIDWDKFLNYWNVSLNDLIVNENEYDDHEVSNFLQLAAEEVYYDGEYSSLQEFVDKVLNCALDPERIADYCAGIGISDAGMVVGIDENRDILVEVCKEYYEDD